MKYRLAAALLLALPSAALAQEETPAIAIEEPPAATVPAADPETVKKAEALIAEVSKTYKDAKTLTDSIQMKIDSPMGSQTQEMQIAIGEGSDAKLSFPGMSMTALDGKVYIVRDDVADKYMTAPLQGNLGQTLQSIFPGFPLPPQFAFRTDASATEKLGSLSLGMLENPQITGYQTAKSEEGKTTHLIDFAAGNGKGSAHIDDETKLVRRVMMEMQPPGAPPEIKLSAAITMSPKISQTLETPIAKRWIPLKRSSPRPSRWVKRLLTSRCRRSRANP